MAGAEATSEGEHSMSLEEEATAVQPRLADVAPKKKVTPGRQLNCFVCGDPIIGKPKKVRGVFLADGVCAVGIRSRDRLRSSTERNEDDVLRDNDKAAWLMLIVPFVKKKCGWVRLVEHAAAGARKRQEETTGPWIKQFPHHRFGVQG